MKRVRREPPRHREREQRWLSDEPSKASETAERTRDERGGDVPLPEEETYEREPRHRSRNERT